jgi:hypothetical protein
MFPRARCSVSAANGMLAPAAGLALLVALAGCSHPSPGAAAGPAVVRLADCGSKPVPRPAVIVMVCANNSITARDLKWSNWGKPVTAAIGTAVVDLCAYTDCHTGSYGTAPIVVIATRLVRCSAGVSGYSRVQYVFAGTSPFQGTPAGTKYFSHFLTGPSRPGPSSQVLVAPCG